MTKSEVMDFMVSLIIVGGIALFVMTPTFWSMIRSGANFIFG